MRWICHGSLILVFPLGILSVVFAQGPVLEQPTHVEVDPLRIDLGPHGKIETLAMDRRGLLLVAKSSVNPTWGHLEEFAERISLDAGGQEWRIRDRHVAPHERNYQMTQWRDQMSAEDAETREFALAFVDPATGRTITTWKLVDVVPRALYPAADGTIYVAGVKRVARFSENGELLNSFDFLALPGAAEHQDEIHRSHASGMVANDRYFFLALGGGDSETSTEQIVRFQRDLTNPRLIVVDQHGCCSHLDLEIDGNELIVAENMRHRVNRFSFRGERLGYWGRRDRNNPSGFAACCNPVNFDLAADGVLYTAESGIGRVKKYRTNGEFLGVVGYIDTTHFDRGGELAAISCYIPVEVSADGSRIYVMDVRSNLIRVLQRRETSVSFEAP